MRPAWLVFGGVGVGVLVALGLAALMWEEPRQPPDEAIELTFPAVEHDERAAEDLVVAWNRWRTATFVSTGVWSRTVDGADAPLVGDVSIAQAPPRRLVVRLGAVTEQIEGGITTCDASTEDLIVPECTEMTGDTTYAERVDAEMSLVLRYVIGDGRIYDVAELAGCFQVEQRKPALRSPWGRAAQFCFDDPSGALRSSRVRRDTATDVETTSAIRVAVTDEDFSPG